MANPEWDSYDSDAAARRIRTEDAVAEKIAAWLHGRADHIVRAEGPERGKHGVEILRLIADAIRDGDWRRRNGTL